MSEEKMYSLDEALDQIKEAFDEADKYYDELEEKCDQSTKIAVAKWVFKHLVEHAREGGSFRHLIYGRLGFGTEAYAPLCGDGMTISNEFDLNLKEDIRKIVRENKIENKELKEKLYLCDEPGCFACAGHGWPVKEEGIAWKSGDGYRFTCGDHYKKYNPK